MLESLGQRLRQARKALGLTLEETANRARLSKGFLSLLENNRASIGLDAAQRLGRVLGIPLGDFARVNAKRDNPYWLEYLSAKFNICAEAQEALMKVAEESVAYRSVANSALANELSESDRWEKFYLSARPFLPQPGCDPVLHDPKVMAIAKTMGLMASFTVDNILEATDKRITSMPIFASHLPDCIEDFRQALLGALGVEVRWLDDDTDLDALKRDLARFGLLRAIGELAFYCDDEALLGGTYPVTCTHQACRFVCLIDRHTEHKKNRSDFTLWHELAHILVDTEIGYGSVTVEDARETTGGKAPVEMLMDRVAARLAFFPPLFRKEVQKACDSHARKLTMMLVEEVRSKYNPKASRQMTAKAITDQWPDAMVYLEAEMRNKKGESGEKQLRISHLHPNNCATEKGIRFGANMRVPEGSLIYRCFLALNSTSKNETDVAVDLEGCEDLAEWKYSKGTGLTSCSVHVSAHGRRERGQDRIYAFVSAVQGICL